MSSTWQIALPFALVSLDSSIVHAQSALSVNWGGFCKSSLVTQCLSSAVWVFAEELAFILSSKRARCSGVNLSSIPAGMGIWPLVVQVRVDSQKPGFTFSGCHLLVCGLTCAAVLVCNFWSCVFCCATPAGMNTATVIAKPIQCFIESDLIFLPSWN